MIFQVNESTILECIDYFIRNLALLGLRALEKGLEVNNGDVREGGRFC